jgi:phytoene synthase
MAFRAARDECRRHGKDFYFASAFLPRGKRDAAYAVFAFCRMIREAIDAPGEAEDDADASALRHRPLSATGGRACCSSHPLDQRVALLRDRLDDLYAGSLELPAPLSRSVPHHVLHAFGQAARRYQIPRQSFIDIAEGVRRDLLVRRYATWASLERHCRQSAGAAASAIACVLGVTNSDAVEHAVTLGVAMAFTRILTSLKDDSAAGRIYLPLEDLANFRYSERDLAAGVVNDNFQRLMRFQVDRARRLYREAAEGLCWVAGDGSRMAAATVVALSTGVLDAIERQGYDVFTRPPRLAAAQKFRRLALAWRLARRRPESPLHALPPVDESRVRAAAR